MIKSFLKYSTIFLLLPTVFFLGCATSSNFQKPKITTTEINGAQREEILSKIKEQSSTAPKSIKLVSDSKITSAEGSFDFRQIFVFQEPDRLRIEAFPLNTGIALNLLVSKDGNAKYIDMEESVIHEGSAKEDFFGRYLKVPLSERDLKYLLISRFPKELLASADKIKIYSDSQNSYYDVIFGEMQFYWKIDKKTFLTQEFQVRDIFKDKLLIQANYFEFSGSENLTLADKILISIPNYDFELDLNFTKRIINQNIPEELFELE